MLTSEDLCLLQWRCACVYVSRRQKGLALSQPELKLIKRMRAYFRADERPPQALIDQAQSLVTTWHARRRGLIPRRRRNVDRAKRLEAARARRRRKLAAQGTPGGPQSRP